MPKKQITTSMDLRSAYQNIMEILSDIQYEECSSLLEDCLRDRSKINDLDVDVSESEEEDEEKQFTFTSDEDEDENEDDF